MLIKNAFQESLRAIALTIPAILLVACADSAAPSADEAASAAQMDPVDIDPVDAEQFAAVLQANRGQVVLVNLWATWCAPCLKEIPDLLELESNLGSEGFKLLGISLDDPDDASQIREFRDQWFPEFKTFHFNDTDWFALVQALDPNWSSILPTSFIVGRDGAVVDTLTGGKDYDGFETAVRPHL